MSHTILGLGMAALTTAGAVWYLPALADLRAGADRPVSTRLAACATVAGWGTAGALAIALFLTGSWPALAALAGTGAVAVFALSGAALLRRRAEEREEIARWAALRHDGRAPDRARAQRSFAAWTLSGVAAGWAVASALLLAADDGGGGGTVTVVSVAATVCGVFLGIALLRSHALRHH